MPKLIFSSLYHNFLHIIFPSTKWEINKTKIDQKPTPDTVHGLEERNAQLNKEIIRLQARPRRTRSLIS